MCVPASKESARRQQWLRTLLLCAAAVVAGYWSAQRVVAYEISVLVEAETAFLVEGIIPCYAPSELRISAEAADDIEDLQRYVWLLAQHDLAASAAWPHTQAPFLEAALDLASAEPALVHNSMQHLAAFLSPAQEHAHAFLAAAPIAWGQWLPGDPAALSILLAQPHAAIAQIAAPA